MAQTLTFQESTPDPVGSVQLLDLPMPQCGPGQVLVRFLAVPINRLDIVVMQGKYPVKAQNHTMSQTGEVLKIPGSDGAARVLAVGGAVTGISPGDIVIVNRHCLGTFRTHVAIEQHDVLKMPQNIDVHLASIMRMVVAPAYFLLKDYHPLAPGDWVIQTAATGTIAHFVCQFARLFGVKVISVIRNRPRVEELETVKHSLKMLGASLVLTEEELDTTTELEGKRITGS
ncbi:hypothetical protein AJ79_08752 [Helicocarpus griseus UAMH5409]|uniref:enoyl-[acyl-carrier-protein] reductase n=1 Tax=Helicocarpus griseus UAMH5409 TaxID=1447875 RepID=A0A2B7WQL4_9EURO|nr:hypothetical protein AJ79_08752 [Helicocarpus griseus UAMH5409]